MTVSSTAGGDPVEEAKSDDGESGELRKCHRFPICGNLTNRPRALCEMCQRQVDAKVEAKDYQ